MIQYPIISQLLAVRKVKSEMETAKESVKALGTTYSEQFLDAYCLSLRNAKRDDVLDLEEKYKWQYKLINVHEPELRVGEPLKKVVLKDCKGKIHQCEFGKVYLYNIFTEDTSRYFSFKNDGSIRYSKGVKQEKIETTPRRISYTADYNVLTSDFSIDICDDEIDPSVNNYKIDYYTVSLGNNILVQKLNGVSIVINLITNEKSIVIDENSRDLPMEEIERMIVEMVQRIRPELPLPGLVERIDNYLELLQEDFSIVDTKSPELELSAN